MWVEEEARGGCVMAHGDGRRVRSGRRKKRVEVACIPIQVREKGAIEMRTTEVVGDLRRCDVCGRSSLCAEWRRGHSIGLHC